MEPRIEVLTRLGPTDVAHVGALVDRATQADRTPPLSEHARLHLQHGGDSAVRHVLARAGDALVGYAQVDPTDPVAGSSAELVVDPPSRRRGIGRQLVATALTVSPDGRLRLWAHGDHPAAGRLAHEFGLDRVRTLWQLRRPLGDPLPDAPLPHGVTVRTFRPGQDDDAWVALNAAAFAGHPEQGRWTVEDLRHRTVEGWFDPAGFFLAERDGRLVGFHWTKVHGGGSDSGHGHPPIGEVYVVGVGPSERGTGLGRALTVIGLEHLRGLGLVDVLLYVDADNEAALRLYEGLGFQRWSADVMFST